MSESRSRRSTSIGSGGGSSGSGSGNGIRKASSPRPVKQADEKEKSKGSTSSGAGPTLRRREFLLRSNLSMDASCSSDASTESFCSRASTGRIGRRLSGGSTISSSYTSGLAGRRSNSFSRPGKGKLGAGIGPTPEEMPGGKRRCAWITATTDPCYVAFHDEEWGVPVHDDKRLFELFVLSGALAELTWPSILSKRHVFREVFMDFEPLSVSKINEKKLIIPGSCATSLLSETKLRAIVENAREMLKIVDEFGSFDRYIWGFVNNSPIVGRFRYQRQVPVKTSKADLISKDLVRRGFRGVGPTVIYSFMQACGLTNDHLISCYRFDECNTIFGNGACASSGTNLSVPGPSTDIEELVAKNVDDLSIS